MSHHIKIEWNASPGVISGYNIYRGSTINNISNVPLNSSPIVSLFYNDTTVFPGHVYTYAVKSIHSGIESLSSLIIVTPAIPYDSSPIAINLGAASGFGLLAGSTITNTGTTEITGDVGLSPGVSITGFTAPSSISGSYHVNDFVAGYAKDDLATAFAAGNAIPSQFPMIANLGGLTLGPGVYTNASSVGITGILILNAHGNPNATWIFQVGSTLTTATNNSYVILVGGAQPANIFWLVGSSATIGTNTVFVGNILAQTSITVTTGAIVGGRLLAMNGAITLDSDSLSVYSAAPLISLPPSPPNTPPAPPLAPTNVHVTEED